MNKYDFLLDTKISLKAKGLLIMLIGVSKATRISINKIKSYCKESDSSIRSAIKELIENDYLAVNKIMPDESTTGRIEYDYIIKV